MDALFVVPGAATIQTVIYSEKTHNPRVRIKADSNCKSYQYQKDRNTFERKMHNSLIAPVRLITHIPFQIPFKARYASANRPDQPSS